jgi:hypothetical protein
LLSGEGIRKSFYPRWNNFLISFQQTLSSEWWVPAFFVFNFNMPQAVPMFFSEDRGDSGRIQPSNGVVRRDPQLGARNVLGQHPLEPGGCADHDSSRPARVGQVGSQGSENLEHPKAMTAIENDDVLELNGTK